MLAHSQNINISEFKLYLGLSVCALNTPDYPLTRSIYLCEVMFTQ